MKMVEDITMIRLIFFVTPLWGIDPIYVIHGKVLKNPHPSGWRLSKEKTRRGI